MLALACALAFTLWADYVRMKRVEYVSSGGGEDARHDPHSPTGYADGKRWLIVPEHDNPTYQWIEETQLMLAGGDWRVRRVDYENAPFGREVHSASPYRWWLVLVARLDRAFSGQPIGLCVERAALYANPILQLALLVVSTLFVARRFGPFCASLFSLGLAAVFPLAGAFVPGVANDFGLEQTCTLWSALLLVAGTMARERAPCWFFAAGVAGGCGLWLSAMGQVPIIAGIAAGGVLAALLARRRPADPPANAGTPLPWRAWALGGAASSLLAYLIEFYPGHMGSYLRANHPLYGLAWLGAGELLSRFSSWMRGERPFASPRSIAIWVLSAAALAALPVAMWRSGDRAFLADDLLSSRLTDLPGGAVSTSLLDWLVRDGLDGAFAAAALPLLLVAPAAWLLFRSRADASQRAAIAITLGPVLVALAFAAVRLRWWNTLDAVLLALVVAATAIGSRAGRWYSAALLGVIVAFGLAQVAPSSGAGGSREFKFTKAEVEGLYERMLSHWIADRAGPGGATVLAPPYRTSSFCFYGGLRGLGTQNRENTDGLSATFHIVASASGEESRAVIGQRGVTHIVLPSWDTDLEDFARLSLKNPEDSFIYALHRTDGGIFGWLRPIPYELPPVAGFEDRSVLVLGVTDETDPATTQSRLVEYLIEMRQIDQASAASRQLVRYPADLGSQVALAQLAKARGDEEAFRRALHSIVSSLSAGANGTLAWDRRVSLAVALALGGREDLSRVQVRRCIGEISESRIRFLTTESLYHLLVLANRNGIEIANPGLHALALRLLPEKLRGSL
jgi:hypothetical protein